MKPKDHKITDLYKMRTNIHITVHKLRQCNLARSIPSTVERELNAAIPLLANSRD
jgi:hypothetical protein